MRFTFDYIPYYNFSINCFLTPSYNLLTVVTKYFVTFSSSRFNATQRISYESITHHYALSRTSNLHTSPRKRYNDWKHSKLIFMKMSDPTDTGSNGECSTCLEESESFSRQKRQCRSSSPIAAQPDDVAGAAAVVSNEKTISDIPDAVLALSLTFVGKGTFRYTASVCKTFHKVYKCAFHDTTDTSMESAVATIACAEMFLEEEGGGLEINIRVRDMDRVRKLRYIWNGAARHGRVEILEWMNKSNHSNCFDSETAGVAAEHGHQDALKWLHAHGCPIDDSTCAYAAYGGHLSILQWCRANECPWNKLTCAYAAYGGHLSILQWCRANGCPWNEGTCSNAAKNGHLSLLQWCRANGCPWNESTCSMAAENGHLGLLQWCRANGCPWNRRTCDDAMNQLV